MMIKLEKILVPIDFSQFSAKALRYGEELATKFHAELHLLHAFEIMPIMNGDSVYFPPDLAVQEEAAAAKTLDEQQVDVPDDVHVVREMKHGHPFVEVVRYAKENDIGLIVMGTHGRGAIAHMLLGSVAERVVRKAPCPVLTVRDEEHEFVMP